MNEPLPIRNKPQPGILCHHYFVTVWWMSDCTKGMQVCVAWLLIERILVFRVASSPLAHQREGSEDIIT